MDEQARLRQFYLRVLLTLGIIWGVQPLIMAPFTFRGANDSTFSVIAVVLNSLTILPACILAFWHRRAACIWLSANGAVIVAAISSFFYRIHSVDASETIGITVPVVIAVSLDIMEMRGWPGALDREIAPRSAKRG